MAFISSKRKYIRKILSKYNRMICTTFNSHVISRESNDFNKSNSDNVIGNSILPHINIQNESPFNTPVDFIK